MQGQQWTVTQKSLGPPAAVWPKLLINTNNSQHIFDKQTSLGYSVSCTSKTHTRTHTHCEPKKTKQFFVFVITLVSIALYRQFYKQWNKVHPHANRAAGPFDSLCSLCQHFLYAVYGIFQQAINKDSPNQLATSQSFSDLTLYDIYNTVWSELYVKVTPDRQVL